MEGKRHQSYFNWPSITKIIAWLLIISNSIYLSLYLTDFPKEFTYGTLFGVLNSPLIFIGCIIAGFQILKLKEFGRGLVLFVCVFDICVLILGTIIYNATYPEGSKPFTMVLFGDFYGFATGFLANCILIFYFTRPKVKELFWEDDFQSFPFL